MLGLSKIPHLRRVARIPTFYGWVIVAAGFSIACLTSLIGQGFATYLSLLEKEFGWSRTQLAGPRSLTQLEGAILGPVNGFLVDRFGPRVTVIAGILLLGSGLVLFGLIQNITQYFIVNVVMGLGTSLAGVLAIQVAVNRWFRRKRTKAISLTQLGISVSGLVAIPILIWTQSQFGWRSSAIVCGVAI